MLCVTDCIGKMHAAHEQADEPQEITSIVADCLDGTADEAETQAFIRQTGENAVSCIRFLSAMAPNSPEAMSAIANVASALDGLSNIPGLPG